MDSIIQKKKECFVCHSQRFLETHHVFYGTANRKISDRLGLVIWCCPACHRGPAGVHHNHDLDMKIKRISEKAFMEHYGKTEDEFRQVFGKSYL